MPRDITNDAYSVQVVQPDGSTLTVPHLALAWEHPAQELSVRLRVQVPNAATDNWDPNSVAEGTFWRLVGGPADNMQEINRGRFLGHGTGLDPNEPLQPRGYDMLYHMLNSRVDVYYDDQASAAYIMADIAAQWGIPIDWAHFDGPQTVVGPMYGQRKQVADVYKECLQRARDKGDGEWIIRWGTAGLTSTKPGNNSTVYWFVEGESVFGGSFDFSVEKMLTRVQVLRPSAKGKTSPVQNLLTGKFAGSTAAPKEPATHVTTLDGHTEFGVLQDILYAKAGETDEDAVARGQSYLDILGVPTITVEIIAPLLPDVQKGDKHRALLPSAGIDGYVYVEGFSADEGSRTMHIQCSQDYSDIFSAQQGPPPDWEDTGTDGTDAVDKLGTPGLGTPGVYNASTPPVLQTKGWTCSATSTAWMLQSIGKTASEVDVTNYLGTSRISSDIGLHDASGAGIVSMLKDTYNVDAAHAAVTFDDVLAKAGKTGVIMGGSAWDHWTGVAGVVDQNTLQLANPAPGWMGVGQTLTRDQFARLGPFNAVWVRGSSGAS